MNKHGEFLLSWEGSVLIVNLKGAFNDEGAADGFDAVKKSVSTKNIATWCRLGIWDEEVLGSPTTLKLLNKVHEWCLKNGCKRTAVVVSNSLQKSALESLFGSTAKIFHIEKDAKKWLLSQSNT